MSVCKAKCCKTSKEGIHICKYDRSCRNLWRLSIQTLYSLLACHIMQTARRKSWQKRSELSYRSIQDVIEAVYLGWGRLFRFYFEMRWYVIMVKIQARAWGKSPYHLVFSPSKLCETTYRRLFVRGRAVCHWP